MIDNRNAVLTVKTSDGECFEDACDSLTAKGYDIRFSGRDNGEWWAVLVNPAIVRLNRAQERGVHP